MGARVLVVQHGVKAAGVADPDLTAAGRRQARLVADHLRRDTLVAVVAVVASPRRRARATAAVVAAPLGLPVTIEPRVRERMEWAGPGSSVTLVAFLDEWQRATADRHHVPRPGDSSLDAGARFLAALDDLALAHPEGTTVVVSHGGVTVDALRSVLGDDVVRARAPGLIESGVPPCALTTFVAGPAGSGWQVPSIATTGHLRV